MRDLKALFLRQKLYNQKIRLRQPGSKEEWTQTYLLGMIDELGEVLREINWKKHRKGSGANPDLANIGYEIADLTKYIISLWELWGFSAEDMMNYCHLKSEILENKTTQEFSPIPAGIPVVITDLDGTIADWRGSFVKWLETKGIKCEDSSSTLNMEIDLHIGYSSYLELKEEFESSGGYRTLTPYSDGVLFLQDLQYHHDAYILVFTARPVHRFKRIWGDTQDWLKDNNIGVRRLVMGSESRVIMAASLIKTNPVILLEDNPEFMVRAANDGIRVISRRHPYNSGLVHENILLVNSYSDIDVRTLFKGSEK